MIGASKDCCRAKSSSHNPGHGLVGEDGRRAAGRGRMSQELGKEVRLGWEEKKAWREEKRRSVRGME